MFDPCDTSTFDAAPVESPDNQYYYIGQTVSQGDLVVQSTYTDSVSRTTTNVCGPYTLTAAINSVASTIVGGPIDAVLTSLSILSPSSFKFSSN